MPSPIQVGVIGATGNVGQSVVKGLCSSGTDFVRESFLTKKKILANLLQRPSPLSPVKCQFIAKPMRNSVLTGFLSWVTT